MTSLGFTRVIDRLRKHYRVIAPDLPGFGGSSATDSFSGSLGAYADFVYDFCAALQLSDLYAYVNDTSGCFGLVGLARMRDRVRGIVIADTVPLPLTGRAWIVRFVLRTVVASRLVRALNRRFNLFAWLVARVAPLWRQLPCSLRDQMCRQFETPQKRDRIVDVLEQIGTDDAFMRRAAESARELQGKPALILFGQFDPMRLIGGVARWRAVFPKSATSIVPLEEHFPILGSGDRVAQEVHSWVSSLPPESAA